MERVLIETKMNVDDSGIITGLGWPFGSGDRVGDWIEPGAFKNLSLPLPMLFGHDQSDPVGSWSEAYETSEGLQIKGNLLVGQVTRAREIFALVKAGAVQGLSIGFMTKKAEPRKGGGRTIKALDLMEVSLVTLPMHPGAKITSAKSAVDAINISTQLQRATAHMKARMQ